MDSLPLQIVLNGALFGFFATAIMDLSNFLGKKFQIHKGGSYALIGRWVGGFFHGQFRYQNILSANPINNEVFIGGVAHYGIGSILGVSYCCISKLIGVPADNLWWGTAFGIFTNILPWFWLFPAFGFGVLAIQGPQGNTLIRSSFLNHVAFGVALALAAKILILLP